eukprot:gb/GECG01015654.1/.p1 GENE.gb/GECG01015654.1/~~gb/GECG01015654.1/.p1  ORF type:complete len:389 (+),score=38.16 gb/GECG01015654.1/:1-1167(+)
MRNSKDNKSPKKFLSARENIETAESRVSERLKKQRARWMFEKNVWATSHPVNSTSVQSPSRKSRQTVPEKPKTNRGKLHEGPRHLRLRLGIDRVASHMIANYDHTQVAHYPNMEEVLHESTVKLVNYEEKLQRFAHETELERRLASEKVSSAIFRQNQERLEESANVPRSPVTTERSFSSPRTSARDGTTETVEDDTGTPQLVANRQSKQRTDSKPRRQSFSEQYLQSIKAKNPNRMLRIKDLPSNLVTSAYSISPSSGRLLKKYQNSENADADGNPKVSYEERIHRRALRRVAFETLHMRKVAWLILLKVGAALYDLQCGITKHAAEKTFRNLHNPYVYKLQRWWKAMRFKLEVTRAQSRRHAAAELLKRCLRYVEMLRLAMRRLFS